LDIRYVESLTRALDANSASSLSSFGVTKDSGIGKHVLSLW